MCGYAYVYLQFECGYHTKLAFLKSGKLLEVFDRIGKGVQKFINYHSIKLHLILFRHKHFLLTFEVRRKVNKSLFT